MSSWLLESQTRHFPLSPPLSLSVAVRPALLHLSVLSLWLRISGHRGAFHSNPAFLFSLWLTISPTLNFHISPAIEGRKLLFSVIMSNKRRSMKEIVPGVGKKRLLLALTLHGGRKTLSLMLPLCKLTQF